MYHNLLNDLELHVYISCWVEPNSTNKKVAQKNRRLAELILSLSKIPTRSLDVDIFTNIESEYWAHISEPIWARVNSSFQINLVSKEDLTVTEKNIFIPWLLTWAHKKKMKTDVLAGNNNSVFLYLEDDAIFTTENLSYYLAYVPILKRAGLIPGFIRAEWSEVHNRWINPDTFSSGSIKSSFKIDGSGDEFCQRENPYSASILLNYEYALEYVSSESFKQEEAWKKHPIIFDIGSTAALGLISERIPEGFINRMATPINPINRHPVLGCVIRHQGDRYASDIWQRHYTLFGLNPGEKLPNNRTPRDYLLRLLSKDFMKILKDYINNKF
jgi:hypothetical protein